MRQKDEVEHLNIEKAAGVDECMVGGSRVGEESREER
jgi:hypothetical protein